MFICLIVQCQLSFLFFGSNFIPQAHNSIGDASSLNMCFFVHLFICSFFVPRARNFIGDASGDVEDEFHQG